MSATIFIDTETTGKWDFKKEAFDPTQPHMVQLAAILEDREIYREYNTLVKIPKDVEIEKDAYKVHGISKSELDARGEDLETALLFLSGMIWHAQRVVCHNTDFDLKILAAAYNRAALRNPPPPFTQRQQFCTMRQSTNICKLPGEYGYKWPKLDEAFRILVDPKGFEGAHDALADVKACREVYKVLTK